jgi:hypothetical protein
MMVVGVNELDYIPEAAEYADGPGSSARPVG